MSVIGNADGCRTAGLEYVRHVRVVFVNMIVVNYEGSYGFLN